jgi:hypothetical protein
MLGALRLRTASMKEGGRERGGLYGRVWDRGAHEQLTPGATAGAQVSRTHAIHEQSTPAAMPARHVSVVHAIGPDRMQT